MITKIDLINDSSKYRLNFLFDLFLYPQAGHRSLLSKCVFDKK